jgi:hypothetical protein
VTNFSLQQSLAPIALSPTMLTRNEVLLNITFLMYKMQILALFYLEKCQQNVFSIKPKLKGNAYFITMTKLPRGKM